MKYLLDSMTWLWSIGSVERLSKIAREIMESGGNLLGYDRRELSIKARMGKLQLLRAPTSAYLPSWQNRACMRY